MIVFEHKIEHRVFNVNNFGSLYRIDLSYYLLNSYIELINTLSFFEDGRIMVLINDMRTNFYIYIINDRGLIGKLNYMTHDSN